MKVGLAILTALVVGGCKTLSANVAGTSPDKTFLAAARHCHSKQVIRMRAGVQNVFYVGGLVDPRTEKPSGASDAKRIECVRQYLGIPSKDVVVVFS